MKRLTVPAGMPDAAHSAWRVALRRAAHQLYDVPVVFEDRFAVRLLGAAGAEALKRTPAAGKRVWSRSLRAFVVARTLYAEQCLAEAYRAGVRQYCLLGAGLDTFAWRNPWPELRVVELDLPEVQRWKSELAGAAGLPEPQCERVAGDLDEPAWPPGLLDAERPVFFAMLGVMPFLPPESVERVLARISECAPGSAVVFDYRLPRASLPAEEQRQFDSLQKRATAKGEPFRSAWTPEEMRHLLRRFSAVEELDAGAIHTRYFAGRADGLTILSRAVRLVHALC